MTTKSRSDEIRCCRFFEVRTDRTNAATNHEARRMLGVFSGFLGTVGFRRLKRAAKL